MAYIDQAKKAEIAPFIKKICTKYGVKASLAIRHHSTLVLNIKSGKIDFIGNYNSVGTLRDPVGTRVAKAEKDIQVNPYWYHEHFDGVALKFLTDIMVAMNRGNHDRSDIQSDYFDVGWYVDVNIGKWDKPYVLEK